MCSQVWLLGTVPPLAPLEWPIPQHLHLCPISVLASGSLVLSLNRRNLAHFWPLQGPSCTSLPLPLPGFQSRDGSCQPWLLCRWDSVLFPGIPLWEVVWDLQLHSPSLFSQYKCSLPDGWLYSFIKLSCSNSSWKIQFRGSIVKNSVSLSTLLSPHFFCHLTPIMGC